MQYQQRFGVLKHQNIDIVDFESLLKNFEFTPQREPFNPEQELCSLLVDAFSSTCHTGKFRLEDSDFSYEINPPVAFKAAEIVARDKEILTEKPYQLPFMSWEKRILIIEANLMPRTRHLFKALPNTGITWECLDDGIFEFIEYCNTYQSADNEEKPPYYANKRDHDLGIISTPNLDDYFKHAAKKLPSDVVVANFDAFGKWPEGFPPSKEHYLSQYKKLRAIK